MPIHFVGDWCFESLEGSTKSYQLPSWTEGGLCTKILSIHQYGFYGEGRHCEPLKVKVTKETARSGTAYTALVTARCAPDGPVTPGKVQSFEINRYKGNLSVIEK